MVANWSLWHRPRFMAPAIRAGRNAVHKRQYRGNPERSGRCGFFVAGARWEQENARSSLPGGKVHLFAAGGSLARRQFLYRSSRISL